MSETDATQLINEACAALADLHGTTVETMEIAPSDVEGFFKVQLTTGEGLFELLVVPIAMEMDVRREGDDLRNYEFERTETGLKLREAKLGGFF